MGHDINGGTVPCVCIFFNIARKLLNSKNSAQFYFFSKIESSRLRCGRQALVVVGVDDYQPLVLGVDEYAACSVDRRVDRRWRALSSSLWPTGRQSSSVKTTRTCTAPPRPLFPLFLLLFPLFPLPCCAFFYLFFVSSLYPPPKNQIKLPI